MACGRCPGPSKLGHLRCSCKAVGMDDEDEEEEEEGQTSEPLQSGSQ